jgi:glutathione-regulated potassium-efflux system ancillary protein KefF
MGVVVIHAHPYPRRSRAGRALLRALEGIAGLDVRSLYDRYPDFAIDVLAEQGALREATAIVWQTPFYWYGVPSLLSHWFEKVLEHGFAHGPGGDALCGKKLLWATTTGTPKTAYEAAAMHRHPFAEFLPPIEQTARFCGLEWQPPLVIHSAHDIADVELTEHAREYRRRVEALLP